MRAILLLALAAAAPQESARAVTAFPSPPPRSVVFAAPAGADGVGLAIVPARSAGERHLLQVSVVDGDGAGVAGLGVRLTVTGTSARVVATAAPCGAGCYRASISGRVRPRRVAVDLAPHAPRRLSFDIGGAWPPSVAGPIVVRASRAFRALRTVTFDDSLSAGTGVTVRSRWRVAAPDRVAFSIAGGGAGVIIGARRWDRAAAGPWQASEQQPPLQQPQPSWVGVTNARVVGEEALRGRRVWRITFFDPRTPGWFEVHVDKRTYRTYRMRMVAPAHFMTHVYTSFDRPLAIVPPV